MIFVDRNRVSRPSALLMNSGSPARREFDKAVKFYDEKNKGGQRQQRFLFSIYKRPEVRRALEKLFHGKCAYCEVRYSQVQPTDVEMFRPKSGVVESPTHPGYWWLAMEWNNLLPSCIDCNRIRAQDGIKTGKGNRFPLEDESNRAFRPEDNITGESPLLLDPCADHPEEHLVFEESGHVVSDTKRGQTTITVLGLNRPGLVAARRSAALLVIAQLHRYDTLSASSAPKSLLDSEFNAIKALIKPEEEFAALKRQLVKAWTYRVTGGTGVFPSTAGVSTPHISEARKRKAKAEFSQFEQIQASYSLADEKGKEKYRGQRRFIERIKIKNIKAIKSLELNLTTKGSPTGWYMLLGENSTGKSTVLQMTTLALLGKDQVARLFRENGVRPNDFIRSGCKTGTVSVKLSGFPDSHTLTVKKNRIDFDGPTGRGSAVVSGKTIKTTGKGWLAQMSVLGYGATRLLPRKDGTAPSPSGPLNFSRVENLFDPFTPLFDAQQWMLRLPDSLFDKVAEILKDLLALDPSKLLDRYKGNFVLVENRSRTPLRALSDGYQSMIAMTVDILEVAIRLWGNPTEAEGVVIIDELGAHLHPTWKMKVIRSLRKSLPSMQFLVTTHDPLCLRGLEEKEVAVMRRDADKNVVALTDLPSPTALRVDQLLTSDFFGLNSTVDPEVEERFDEYYALLAKPKHSKEEKAKLRILTDQLKSKRYLGDTLRENLMYEAVDRLLAQHRVKPIPIDELQRAAVQDIAQIWNASVKARKRTV